MKKTISLMTVLMLLFSVQVASAVSLESVFVSDVFNLENYTALNYSTFQPKETVTIYTQLNNVNHDGFIFADFVFIIKDPKNNLVAMDQRDVSYRGYEKDTYISYTFEIPEFWVDGKYKMEIYAYDRADDSKIREVEREAIRSKPGELLDYGTFDSYKKFFGTGDNARDMGVIKSYSNSKVYKTNTDFNVKRGVPKSEQMGGVNETEEVEMQKSKFVVTALTTDKFQVAPNESIMINLEVENVGAPGTKTIEIFINDELESEKSITLGRGESKTVQFEVKKELPGTYKITIPKQNAVKLFFVIDPSSGSSNVTEMPLIEEESKPKINFIGIIFTLIVAVVLLGYYRQRVKGVNCIDLIQMPETDICEKSQIQSSQNWFTKLMDE